MARKPNKRQRENARIREQRAQRTRLFADPKAVRRPLAGYGEAYEITRSGNLWSRRLSRYIKPAYDPHTGRPYVNFKSNGERVTLSTWRAVIESWFSEEERAALRQIVPDDALGHIERLRQHRQAIGAAARMHRIPDTILFNFLLAGRAD